MTHAEITFAVIVGMISAIGLIWGSVLTSRASDRAAQSSREALEHQIKLNAKAKIAEFRQEWINSLRNEMARIFAIVLDTEHATGREAVEAAAKIQLMMNRRDSRYGSLVNLLKAFSDSIKAKKQYDEQELVRLCQDILKDEWEVLKRELLELNSPPT